MAKRLHNGPAHKFMIRSNQECRPLGSVSSLKSATRFYGIEFASILAGRDPHDADSIADHVGGALLTWGALGIFRFQVRQQILDFPQFGFKRGDKGLIA